MEKSVYSKFGVFAGFIKYMDEHPTLFNTILVLEAIAAILAALNYNFTTNI